MTGFGSGMNGAEQMIFILGCGVILWVIIFVANYWKGE